jgi:hypothetical protein
VDKGEAEVNPEQEIKLLLDKVFDLALKANATLTVYNDGVVVTVSGRFVGSWAGRKVIQMAGGRTPS